VLPGAAIPSHSNNVGLIHSVPHPYQSHSRPAYYPRHMRKEKVRTAVKHGHSVLQAAAGFVYVSLCSFMAPSITVKLTGKSCNRSCKDKLNTRFTSSTLFLQFFYFPK
jgi:hypothetical protein